MQLRASGGAFGELVRVFSLLAIITSTVGFVYGLVRRSLTNPNLNPNPNPQP